MCKQKKATQLLRFICTLPQTPSNELYFAGHNGIDISGRYKRTYEFTQIPISIMNDGIDAKHTNTKVIVSTGLSNLRHTFIAVITDEDTKLLANGVNNFGQLGLAESDATFMQKPVPILWDKSIHKLKSISCTSYASFFLMENGDLFACGEYLSEEEVGPIFWKSNIKAVAVNREECITLTNEGKVDIYGFNSDKFEKENILIDQIDCGKFHYLMVTVDGVGYAYGSFSHGLCGNGKMRDDDNDKQSGDPQLIVLNDKNERIIDISCGRYHNILLTDRNNIYGFGENIGCNILSDEECIVYSHLIDKEKELGLKHNEYIEAVYAVSSNMI